MYQVSHQPLVKISFLNVNNYLNSFFFNLGLEKLINPFMRVENVSVQKVTKTIGDPIKTMKMLRDLKNNL